MTPKKISKKTDPVLERVRKRKKAPHVTAWLAGGCMVCGEPNRDSNYAHSTCYANPWTEWDERVNECLRAQVRYAALALEALEVLKQIQAYVDDHVDVEDGHSGPRPNWAMRFNEEHGKAITSLLTIGAVNAAKEKP